MLAEGLVFESQHIQPTPHVVLVVEVFFLGDEFAESVLLFLVGAGEVRQQIHNLDEKHVVMLLERIGILLQIAPAAPEEQELGCDFPIELYNFYELQEGLFASPIDPTHDLMQQLEVTFEDDLIVLQESLVNQHKNLEDFRVDEQIGEVLLELGDHQAEIYHLVEEEVRQAPGLGREVFALHNP